MSLDPRKYYAFLMPFAAIPSITIIKAVLLIFSCVYVFVKFEKTRKLNIDFLLIIFVLTTQLLHSLFFGDLDSLKNYWIGTSLAVVVFSVNKMTFREFMIPFFFGLSLSVLFELLTFDWSKMSYVRFSGKMFDPNFFAFFVLSSAYLASSNLKRLALYFLALLSLSKTALIYIFVRERKRIVGWRTIVPFLVFGYLSYDLFSERLFQSWALSDHDLNLYLANSSRYQPRSLFGIIPYEAFSLRVGLWVHAFHYSWSVFPIGVGFGNYLKNFMEYIIPGVLPVPMHPHNTYLHLIVDYGILGILYSIIFLRWLFRVPSRYMRTLLLLFSCTLTFISTPLFYILLLLDYENSRN